MEKNTDQEKLLHQKPGAARTLSISVRGLERLIANKAIKIVRIGGRVLISQRELEAFVRKNAQ